MSTKADFMFIESDTVRVYWETSEPQSIFGKWIGDNVYVEIDTSLVRSLKIEGHFLIIHLLKNEYLPMYMKIWGDAVVQSEFDIYEGILIVLKGGHYITKQLEKEKSFDQFIPKP